MDPLSIGNMDSDSDLMMMSLGGSGMTMFQQNSMKLEQFFSRSTFLNHGVMGEGAAPTEQQTQQQQQQDMEQKQQLPQEMQQQQQQQQQMPQDMGFGQQQQLQQQINNTLGGGMSGLNQNFINNNNSNNHQSGGNSGDAAQDGDHMGRAPRRGSLPNMRRYSNGMMPQQEGQGMAQVDYGNSSAQSFQQQQQRQQRQLPMGSNTGETDSNAFPPSRDTGGLTRYASEPVRSTHPDNNSNNNNGPPVSSIQYSLGNNMGMPGYQDQSNSDLMSRTVQPGKKRRSQRRGSMPTMHVQHQNDYMSQQQQQQQQQQYFRQQQQQQQQEEPIQQDMMQQQHQFEFGDQHEPFAERRPLPQRRHTMEHSTQQTSVPFNQHTRLQQTGGMPLGSTGPYIPPGTTGTMTLNDGSGMGNNASNALANNNNNNNTTFSSTSSYSSDDDTASNCSADSFDGMDPLGLRPTGTGGGGFHLGSSSSTNKGKKKKSRVRRTRRGSNDSMRRVTSSESLYSVDEESEAHEQPSGNATFSMPTTAGTTPATTRRRLSASTTSGTEPLMAQGSPDLMVRLQESMARSMKRSMETQKALQNWDKQNGLPKSHSQTMVNSSRSRQQLQDGVILAKWDGTPLISPDTELGKPKARRASTKPGGTTSTEKGKNSFTSKMERRMSAPTSSMSWM